MKNTPPSFPSKPRDYLFILAFPILGLAAGYATSSAGNEQEIQDEELVKYALLAQRRPTSWSDQKVDLKSQSSTDKDRKRRLNSLLAKQLRGDIPKDWNEDLMSIIKLTTNNMEERQDALYLAFSKWAETDFDAAFRTAGKTGFHARAIKKGLLDQLAARDIQAAVKYYAAHKEELVPYNTFPESIARNWAKISPEEAFTWCLTNKDPYQEKRMHPEFANNNFLTAFMESILMERPGQVVSYLDRIQQEKRNVPANFIKYWAKTSPEDAIKWYDTAKGTNKSHLSALIMGIANNNIKLAEELIVKQPQEEWGSLYPNIEQIIWSSQGTEAALNWSVSKMTKDSYLFPLISWTNNDPEAARQWVEKLPANEVKDLAINRYATTSLLYHSELVENTMAIIDTMSDPKQKEKTRKEAVQSWQKYSPDEFNKWMSDPANPEQLKSMIRKAL